MDDRTQLIGNLNTIRQGLDFINEKQIYLNEIEGTRRKLLSSPLGNGKTSYLSILLKLSFYAIVLGAFGNVAIFVFFALLGQPNLINIFWYLVASIALIFLLKKKMRKHTERWIDICIYILIFLTLVAPLAIVLLAISAFLNSDLTSAVIFGLLSIAIILVSFWLEKLFYPRWDAFINGFISKENRKLIAQSGKGVSKYADHNEPIEKLLSEKSRCESELNQAAQAIKVFGKGWYPKDYYFIDAVDFFIDSLQNFRADNIKELVNLYDDTQYKTAQLAYQQELIRLQREQNFNSQEMAKLLRFNNYLQSEQVHHLKHIRMNTAEADSYLKNLNAWAAHKRYHF